MKYEITVEKNNKVEVLSASCICEMYDLLNEYKSNGYKVKDVSNAFRKPRGIFRALSVSV